LPQQSRKADFDNFMSRWGPPCSEEYESQAGANVIILIWNGGSRFRILPKFRLTNFSHTGVFSLEKLNVTTFTLVTRLILSDDSPESCPIIGTRYLEGLSRILPGHLGLKYCLALLNRVLSELVQQRRNISPVVHISYSDKALVASRKMLLPCSQDTAKEGAVSALMYL
jgi:hypothetical protein